MRISGAKRLLEKADLENKIISGDAIFAQLELSKTVIEKGGEYLSKLRANQGAIYRLAVAHFEQLEDQYPGRAHSLEKGHGRIDEREMRDEFSISRENRVSISGASFPNTPAKRSNQDRQNEPSNDLRDYFVSGGRVWSKGIISFDQKALGNRKRTALSPRCDI